jgi:penicillin-binding protein 1C
MAAANSGPDASAQPPLRIAFPPRGAEIEIASQPNMAGGVALPLKAEGGTLPLTWLVDGHPLPSSPYRREAIWSAKGPGFVQVTVVDAEGRSDRSEVRLR